MKLFMCLVIAFLNVKKVVEFVFGFRHMYSFLLVYFVVLKLAIINYKEIIFGKTCLYLQIHTFSCKSLELFSS